MEIKSKAEIKRLKNEIDDLNKQIVNTLAAITSINNKNKFIDTVDSNIK